MRDNFCLCLVWVSFDVTSLWIRKITFAYGIFILHHLLLFLLYPWYRLLHIQFGQGIGRTLCLLPFLISSFGHYQYYLLHIPGIINCWVDTLCNRHLRFFIKRITNIYYSVETDCAALVTVASVKFAPRFCTISLKSLFKCSLCKLYIMFLPCPPWVLKHPHFKWYATGWGKVASWNRRRRASHAYLVVCPLEWK